MVEKICPECGAKFVLTYSNQACCSDKCKLNRKRQQMRESYRHGQSMTLAEEREEKARRRAEFFAARDAAFARAGLPVPKIEIRNGVRVETRGQRCIALSAGGLVEAMRQKEAICAKCRDGEPPKNCRFFGEPDGCSSPTYGHYPQLPIGNAAKLREAVKAVVDVGYPHNFQREAPHIRGYCYDITRAIEKCFAALGAPPRNCDLYKTKEQAQDAFLIEPCDHPCGNCWVEDINNECGVEWLLAPATEKEGGNR